MPLLQLCRGAGGGGQAVGGEECRDDSNLPSTRGGVAPWQGCSMTRHATRQTDQHGIGRDLAPGERGAPQRQHCVIRQGGDGAAAGVQRNIATTRCCWCLGYWGGDCLSKGGRMIEGGVGGVGAGGEEGWDNSNHHTYAPLRIRFWGGDITRWHQREQWQCRRRAMVVVVEWSCCFMPPTTSRGKEQDGLISTIVVP